MARNGELGRILQCALSVKKMNLIKLEVVSSSNMINITENIKKLNDFAQDRTGDVLRVKQMP